ncbi:MAG: tRNA pseudouridine(38-40) synthase TruA [Chloroflexota bacterium]|nr:tRNA pseudouridine(38-40) synthase TruA [Chloroflexota bacterium]
MKSNRRLALTVEYDGTNYQGFQLQSNEPTIQGELEKALKKLTQESIRVRGASRTDSGAHALGQVIDFKVNSNLSTDQFVNGLNFYLPDDIGIQSASDVPEEFNARKDALTRIYRFNILNLPIQSPLKRFTHHWVKEILDIDIMCEAAKELIGSRDFRHIVANYPKEINTIRTVNRWEIWREQEAIIIESEANGFLRYQIRRVNSILVNIGKGKWSKDILRDTLMAGFPLGWKPPSLPAKGLYLMKVTYPDTWQKAEHETY